MSRGVVIYQNRVIRIHLNFVLGLAQSGIPQPQHCAPTAKCRGLVGNRIQQFAQPVAGKNRIRRRDQVIAGIRQRPVQIENNCPHITLPAGSRRGAVTQRHQF